MVQVKVITGKGKSRGNYTPKCGWTPNGRGLARRSIKRTKRPLHSQSCRDPDGFFTSGELRGISSESRPFPHLHQNAQTCTCTRTPRPALASNGCKDKSLGFCGFANSVNPGMLQRMALGWHFPPLYSGKASVPMANNLSTTRQSLRPHDGPYGQGETGDALARRTKSFRRTLKIENSRVASRAVESRSSSTRPQFGPKSATRVQLLAGSSSEKPRATDGGKV